MPKEFSRAERVAQLIQRKLAHLIQREVKDPRLASFITVSDVEVSSDLSHAKVYISCLNSSDDEVKQTLEILKKASGYLRTKLGKDLKLRLTPELHFHYDSSITYGNRLSKLIDDAVAEDEQKGTNKDD